jgi:hypothetical protein
MDNLFVGNVGSSPSRNLHSLVVVQRLSPWGNLSEMILITIPTNGRKLIGMKSESVIGFIPEW